MVGTEHLARRGHERPAGQALPRALDRHDVSSLVRFCCMGAPIPRALVREAKDRLPGLVGSVAAGTMDTGQGRFAIKVPGLFDRSSARISVAGVNALGQVGKAKKAKVKVDISQYSPQDMIPKTVASLDSGTPPPGLTNPVYAYTRTEACASVTGGAFVPNGVWPVEFDGVYLFSDYVCGTIFKLRPATGGGYTRQAFITGLGVSSATDLYFGRDASGLIASRENPTEICCSTRR